MTAILARFGTAALVGASSFVNLPPCAAMAAERSESRVVLPEAGSAAVTAAFPGRRDHAVILCRVREDPPRHRVTRHGSMTRGS
jgi:hypothetical protein